MIDYDKTLLFGIVVLFLVQVFLFTYDHKIIIKKIDQWQAAIKELHMEKEIDALY